LVEFKRIGLLWPPIKGILPNYSTQKGVFWSKFQSPSSHMSMHTHSIDY